MGDAVKVDFRHLPCRSLYGRLSAFELLVRHVSSPPFLIWILVCVPLPPPVVIGFISPSIRLPSDGFLSRKKYIQDMWSCQIKTTQTLVVCTVSDFCGSTSDLHESEVFVRAYEIVLILLLGFGFSFQVWVSPFAASS